jgi:hypothetical protein
MKICHGKKSAKITIDLFPKKSLPKYRLTAFEKSNPSFKISIFVLQAIIHQFIKKFLHRPSLKWLADERLFYAFPPSIEKSESKKFWAINLLKKAVLYGTILLKRESTVRRGHPCGKDGG